MAKYDKNEQAAGDEIYDLWFDLGIVDIYEVCGKHDCSAFINHVADYCMNMYDLDIYEI